MIVKNERGVILRCLASVKEIIDYWVIVDTGSTDGTQEAIREFMKDIPGELHERPWVDFSHNRNEAISLARNKADYLVLIDADERLVFSKKFDRNLYKDLYLISIHRAHGKNAARVHRTFLIHTGIDWKYRGVLHEEITPLEGITVDLIQGVDNISATEEGYRGRDPDKYLKDAAILEEALKAEPDNREYVFYMAQSYAVAGKDELALKNYQKRAAMGGWDQEVYYSIYISAQLQDILGMDQNLIIENFIKAYEYRPSRAEPLFWLSNYYRKIGDISSACRTSEKGISIPPSNDTIYVEEWIYEYGILEQFMDCSLMNGDHQAAYAASIKLLTKPNLPEEIRKKVEGNQAYCKGFN